MRTFHTKCVLTLDNGERLTFEPGAEVPPEHARHWYVQLHSHEPAPVIDREAQRIAAEQAEAQRIADEEAAAAAEAERAAAEAEAARRAEEEAAAANAKAAAEAAAAAKPVTTSKKKAAA